MTEEHTPPTTPGYVEGQPFVFSDNRFDDTFPNSSPSPDSSSAPSFLLGGLAVGMALASITVVLFLALDYLFAMVGNARAIGVVFIIGIIVGLVMAKRAKADWDRGEV